jgi:hypothetical protein
MIKKEEILPAIVGGMIAAAISTMIVMWKSPPPIEYYHRYVSHDVVYEGDVVTIYWRERRSANCDSIIHRRLIAADNNVTMFEPIHDLPKPVGEDVSGNFSLKIPPGLRTGPLIYRVHVDFRCNMVQRWLGGHTFILPDIIFEYRRRT